jgi:hypothetical protein
MKPERVASAVEMTIVRVTRDIKKRQGNTGSDKLNSLSKLVNAYNRLVDRSKEDTKTDSESLHPNYYEKLEKDCFGEMVAK